jgi:hypothetical protein
VGDSSDENLSYLRDKNCPITDVKIITTSHEKNDSF